MKSHARLPIFLLAFGLAGMLARLLCAGVDLDPDLFHEMSLARATLQIGHVPREDLFAYTPTVYPVVHHEWGSGMIFYLLMSHLGIQGLMALRLMLVAALLLTLATVARRRGASWICIYFTVPIALILLTISFTTVRAQLFTIVFTALLLLILDLAESRSVRWLLAVPILNVIWLNLHGGFVVGLGLVLFYGIEKSVRARRITWPYLITLLVSLSLICVNPYELAYFPFLWKSLTMSRPLITEWKPLWASPLFLTCYVTTIALLLYTAARINPYRLINVAILFVAAIFALMHIRHVSLYAVLWIAFVPGYIQLTPLAKLMHDIWHRSPRAISLLYAVVGLVCFVVAVPQRPWVARLPSTMGEQREGAHVIYPADIVKFLRDGNIRANVLAPFELGAYLSWELAPQIKVAVDGRYEVAYAPRQVEEFIRFYAARGDWQDTLGRYPPDMVLIPRNRPVANPFAKLRGWKVIYEDELFVLYAHSARD